MSKLKALTNRKVVLVAPVLADKDMQERYDAADIVFGLVKISFGSPLGYLFLLEQALTSHDDNIGAKIKG